MPGQEKARCRQRGRRFLTGHPALQQREISVSNHRQHKARGTEGRAGGTGLPRTFPPRALTTTTTTNSNNKQQTATTRAAAASHHQGPPSPAAQRAEERGPRLTPTQPFGARCRAGEPALPLGRVGGGPGGPGRARPGRAGPLGSRRRLLLTARSAPGATPRRRTRAPGPARAALAHARTNTHTRTHASARPPQTSAPPSNFRQGKRPRPPAR